MVQINRIVGSHDVVNTGRGALQQCLKTSDYKIRQFQQDFKEALRHLQMKGP